MTDTEIAYAKVKESILTLAMPPGMAINAMQLGADLRLGRTPVRDALKLLEAEGLVVIVHRRGMSVADISLTDLRQLYEVRHVVEPACAYWSALRMDPERMVQLSSLIQAIESSTDRDLLSLLNQERQIHRLIALGAGNKYLEAEASRFYDLSIRIWYLIANEATAAIIDLGRHTELAKAIARRDAPGAETLMREHVEVFYREMRKII